MISAMQTREHCKKGGEMQSKYCGDVIKHKGIVAIEVVDLIDPTNQHTNYGGSESIVAD
jgi:hypothetical protein